MNLTLFNGLKSLWCDALSKELHIVIIFSILVTIDPTLLYGHLTHHKIYQVDLLHWYTLHNTVETYCHTTQFFDFYREDNIQIHNEKRRAACELIMSKRLYSLVVSSKMLLICRMFSDSYCCFNIFDHRFNIYDVVQYTNLHTGLKLWQLPVKGPEDNLIYTGNYDDRQRPPLYTCILSVKCTHFTHTIKVLKLRWSNKLIYFPSLNRVLARCMPRLISFEIALPWCAARETSENFKMKNSCPQWDSIPGPLAR